MLQSGRTQVRFPMSPFYPNSPNPSARIALLKETQPLTEMTTRNLLRVKPGRLLRPTISPSSVGLLSRQCGMLDVSQTYRPARPAVWICLPFTYLDYPGMLRVLTMGFWASGHVHRPRNRAQHLSNCDLHNIVKAKKPFLLTNL
jgi:hypothetical protein